MTIIDYQFPEYVLGVAFPTLIDPDSAKCNFCPTSFEHFSEHAWVSWPGADPYAAVKLRVVALLKHLEQDHPDAFQLGIITGELIPKDEFFRVRRNLVEE